jgi:hypothetical protein
MPSQSSRKDELSELLPQLWSEMHLRHAIGNMLATRFGVDRLGTSRRPLSVAAAKPFDKSGALEHKTTWVEGSHCL